MDVDDGASAVCVCSSESSLKLVVVADMAAVVVSPSVPSDDSVGVLETAVAWTEPWGAGADAVVLSMTIATLTTVVLLVSSRR